jgi:membrane complex biogenesis BtpA family protein
MGGRLWTRLFPEGGTLVGMVHLEPLPGAPRWAGSLERVIERARADARRLEDAGFDAVLVENYGDVPFFGGSVAAHTVAAITAAVCAVRAAVEVPVGVNVLRNDVEAAVGIAAATGARFVRANVHTGSMWTDQGLVEGRAAHTLRLRDRLGADAAILADVHVKHAMPAGGVLLENAASDAWHRGLADALLVTGAGTGAATRGADVTAVRSAVPGAPVLVASGVTPETVRDALVAASGVIVGSAVMQDGAAGAGVDPERARALVRAARG